MSFFHRFFVFLSLIILGMTSASAELLNDPKTGFSVDLDFPKASICLVYPNKPYDPDQCPIDNYVFPREDASMIARGVMRFNGNKEMLFNMAYLSAPFTAPMSAKEAQFFLEQYMELFNASEVEQIDSGMKMVNQQPFFRYYADVGSDTALPYSRILFYTFSGKGYHYFIVFNFDPSHEEEVFKISDQILNDIKVQKPEYSEGAEIIYRLGIEVVFSSALFLALFLFFNSGSWLFQRIFPKKDSQSIFHGQGIFALEGTTRFFALLILIIGFYEVVTAYKQLDIAEIFLIAYGCGLVLFIVLRQIWRWIRKSSALTTARPSSVPSREIFFPISVSHFIILSIFTAGFYPYYWFYKNWEYIQRMESKLVNPVLKAIFYPICAYFLFTRIRRYGRDRGQKLKLPAGLLAGTLIICFIVDMLPLGYVIPRIYWFLISFLIFIFEFALLIPGVAAINQLNRQFAPEANLNERFSRSEKITCLIGGSIILILIALSVFIRNL